MFTLSKKINALFKVIKYFGILDGIKYLGSIFMTNRGGNTSVTYSQKI